MTLQVCVAQTPETQNMCLSSDASAVSFEVADGMPVFPAQAECTGSEDRLSDCQHSTSTTGECASAGVTCGRSTSERLFGLLLSLINLPMTPDTERCADKGGTLPEPPNMESDHQKYV